MSLSFIMMIANQWLRAYIDDHRLVKVNHWITHFIRKITFKQQIYPKDKFKQVDYVFIRWLSLINVEQQQHAKLTF
jgi:hypothetical protein